MTNFPGWILLSKPESKSTGTLSWTPANPDKDSKLVHYLFVYITVRGQMWTKVETIFLSDKYLSTWTNVDKTVVHVDKVDMGGQRV